MQIRYAVFKHDDLKRYGVMKDAKRIAEVVETRRRADGKKPSNEYFVINRDEPYADEIIEVLKRHGHWDGE